MDYLINLALGVAGSVIAAEIVFHHKRWCQRIIHAAAHRIGDSADSLVKLEEWLAALDEHVGVFSSFSHAIGCWIGAPAVATALKQPVSEAARNRKTESEQRPRATLRRSRVLWVRVINISMGKDHAPRRRLLVEAWHVNRTLWREVVRKLGAWLARL